MRLPCVRVYVHGSEGEGECGGGRVSELTWGLCWWLLLCLLDYWAKEPGWAQGWLLLHPPSQYQQRWLEQKTAMPRLWRPAACRKEEAGKRKMRHVQLPRCRFVFWVALPPGRWR